MKCLDGPIVGKVHFFKESTWRSVVIQKFAKTAPMFHINKMGLKLSQFRPSSVKNIVCPDFMIFVLLKSLKDCNSFKIFKRTHLLRLGCSSPWANLGTDYVRNSNFSICFCEYIMIIFWFNKMNWIYVIEMTKLYFDIVQYFCISSLV